ncbi:outer membrane beta-barrel protein [Yeosuana sp. MJ-SS3]|uniref:Outer membrane beta-barrel protein n=1 Tax=Gilvirhabdus luticola TaxID=3079858 RepID=A0ABU3U9Q6_9FLAO|nr:outer membrane beta-barrel protein [Yeosuana sp. MJ-SS3]MDU8887134.1 outer membrane beta-barrel protein [Yeosuana sp. MJ-SS3]
MKNKFKVILLILFLNSMVTFAQVIEFTPTYGYQFGAKLGYGPNYIKMKDSDQFGATIGIETYNGLMAELSYFNMSTELRIKDRVLSPVENYLSDLNTDWFLIGASKYFKVEKVKPFAGAGLGIVIVSPKNENRDILDNNLSSNTKFAFSFKTGVNIMFSKAIGLNLQGNLFFPVDWAGVYVGPGGAGISTGSTVILGGFSTGLVIRIDAD